MLSIVKISNSSARFFLSHKEGHRRPPLYTSEEICSSIFLRLFLLNIQHYKLISQFIGRVVLQSGSRLVKRFSGLMAQKGRSPSLDARLKLLPWFEYKATSFHHLFQCGQERKRRIRNCKSSHLIRRSLFKPSYLLYSERRTMTQDMILLTSLHNGNGPGSLPVLPAHFLQKHPGKQIPRK